MKSIIGKNDAGAFSFISFKPDWTSLSNINQILLISLRGI